MPVPRDLLGDHEEVLVDLRPHWVFMLGPGALAAAAVVAAIAVVVAYPHAPAAVNILMGILVVVPLGWFLARALRWRGISLVVTTSRLLVRRGLFGQDVVQLRLSRISEVHCTQTIVERILGTGRLVVDVPGAEAPIVLEDVRRPRALQRVLAGQLDRAQSTDSPHEPVYPPEDNRAIEPSSSAFEPLTPPDLLTPPHGVRMSTAPRPERVQASGDSIPDQLIKLDELRRRGIISDDEFDLKKRDLLGRL